MEYIKIDIEKTVHTLCTQNPGLDKVLHSAGFTRITSPGMLNTAGRFMTLKKGMGLMKINFERLEEILNQNGYSAD